MAKTYLQKNFDLDTVVTLAVPGAVISASGTNTGTPNIPMGRSHHIAFIITAIDSNLAGKITAEILQATSTGATPATAAIKSTTFAAGTTSAGIAKILEVEASELDVANGYDHVTIKITTAGADSVAVAVIRGPNRYDPSSVI